MLSIHHHLSKNFLIFRGEHEARLGVVVAVPIIEKENRKEIWALYL
jgi:hypothetical protein